MRRGIVAGIAATCIALAGLGAQAQTWMAPAAARTAMADSNVVVLDARNVGAYAAGHVDGAQSAPWQMFSNMSGKPGDAGYGTLLPADRLGPAIGSLGIDSSTRVLVYSGSPKGSGEDGRIAWTLRAAGLTNVAIIDGGFEALVAAGAPVSKEAKKAQARPFTVVVVDDKTNATKDQVKASLGRARIIDARSPEEYAGAQKFGETRGGHLPGAISLPWNSVFDADGKMRSAADLKKMLTDAGVKPDDEIISYCTIGLRSAHMTEVLKEMGFSKAKNYSASFYEWAGDGTLPLEK